MLPSKMSGEKESGDPNASEEEENGKEQGNGESKGEDEILHLKNKLPEMAEEADSKMLRVACRLILNSSSKEGACDGKE